jgi:hypothetical protein
MNNMGQSPNLDADDPASFVRRLIGLLAMVPA